MNKPKFTPRPWHVEVSEDDRLVDICADPNHCGNLPICRMYGSMDTVAQDNANLIAAAPEMCEALWKIMEIELAIAQEYQVGADDSAIYELAENALRKVRGESEVVK